MSVAKRTLYSSLLLAIIVLTACQNQDQELPTLMPVAPTIEQLAQDATDPGANMPPTWTALPPVLEDTATPEPTEPPPPSSTPVPTSTPSEATPTEPSPTETLLPTATNTPVPLPTDTPVPLPPTAVPTIPTNTPVPLPPTATTAPPPTDTPVPPPPPAPVYGVNLLPNPSFEEGHYNSGGVAELQVPNGWIFIWDGGHNPFVAPPDDYFVRPETRVLPSIQIPPAEHSLFIFDGQHTMKIFKGYWAINVQLVTDVFLEPGAYLLEINVFPDLVVDYDDGKKVYAPDPYSGEVRFIVSGGGTDWFPPAFGQRNQLSHTFTVNEAGTYRVGAGLRSRYGILNNGWFVDLWTLKRIENQ